MDAAAWRCQARRPAVRRGLGGEHGHLQRPRHRPTTTAGATPATPTATAARRQEEGFSRCARRAARRPARGARLRLRPGGRGLHRRGLHQPRARLRSGRQRRRRLARRQYLGRLDRLRLLPRRRRRRRHLARRPGAGAAGRQLRQPRDPARDSATPSASSTRTRAEGGFGALPKAYDSPEFTVMTYRSCVGASTKTGYLFEDWGAPQSYMMLDIAALQALYGADFTDQRRQHHLPLDAGLRPARWSTARSASTPADNRIFATIWDGGGKDTYDLSAYGNDRAAGRPQARQGLGLLRRPARRPRRRTERRPRPRQHLQRLAVPGRRALADRERLRRARRRHPDAATPPATASSAAPATTISAASPGRDALVGGKGDDRFVFVKVSASRPGACDRLEADSRRHRLRRPGQPRRRPHRPPRHRRRHHPRRRPGLRLRHRPRRAATSGSTETEKRHLRLRQRRRRRGGGVPARDRRRRAPAPRPTAADDFLL